MTNQSDTVAVTPFHHALMGTVLLAIRSRAQSVGTAHDDMPPGTATSRYRRAMSDADAHQQPFLTQLSALAWALAVVAAVSLARLVRYASQDVPIEPTHLVWLAVCVLSGCLSVGGFLLVAIKRAEATR